MLTPSAERRRVAIHIRRAERAARGRTNVVDHATRLVRALLLGELARYRREGVFPRNPGLPRTPIFVDAQGTRCAMAHLLEVGGEHALVDRIARERNLAYVPELADEPRLIAWLAAAGLTVAEAAAIQPEYCGTNSDCVCGATFSYVPYPVPARGVLEGHVIRQDPLDGLSMVRLTTIHGEALGYAPGDTIIAYVGASMPGDRALVPVSLENGASEDVLGGVVISDDGGYTCQSQSVRARPVRGTDFIAAVLSDDCAASLAAVGSSWARDTCGPQGGGCAIGGDAPSTVGILLAVVSVLAARTLRGRRAQRAMRRTTVPREIV